MFAVLARKIFGTQNDRILKGFRRQVTRINALEPEIQALGDELLRAQTEKLRARLAEGRTLEDILPEAFATAREAARRALGQRPFDVQLLGAIALHEGFIPEMRTGEGKTLTATLAVYLNALEGKGVHVVTVNDYLAQRDAKWMNPIFEMLGMSVGYIISNMPEEMRRAAYASDVTYGTNNEFGFDYLRDNMKFRLEDMVQRPFNYAIVDEVDSIFIDEARTPLIISGMATDSAEQYRTVDAVIPRLIPEDYEIELKHKTVVLTDKGNEHVEQLLKQMGILREGELYDRENMWLVHHVNQALRAHKLFTRDVEYIVKDDAVIIVDEFTGRMMEGRRFSDGLHQALEAKEQVKIQHENQTLASITFQNYFRMYPKLAGMTGTALTEKAEFEGIYNLRVVEIPTNMPMVREDHHDEIYRTAAEKHEAIAKVIQECRERGQPVLVGTTSIEKSEQLSRHLRGTDIDHQVLNARYHEQEAHIIAQAGRPGTVTIATNMAGRGTDIKLGGNVEMRVAAEVPPDADHQTRAGHHERIKGEVAKHYDHVINSGGLFVIGSERHESRRIDNQLRGRSGRQGDPGASRFYISLEDDLMRIFGSETMDKFLQKMGIKRGQAIVHPWINTAIERAQKKVEAQHFEIRKNLLRFDNVMNDQRKVIYEQRREIMSASDVAEIVRDMRHEVIDNLVSFAIPHGSYPEQWDTSLLRTEALRLLHLHIPIEDWAKEEGIDEQKIAERLRTLSDEHMAEKEKRQFAENAEFEPPDVTGKRLRDMERFTLLETLDKLWRDHLLSLDALRQGITLRAFGQRDPLSEYKQEAFEMFQGLLSSLREKVTADLSASEITTKSQQLLMRAMPRKITLTRGPEFAPPELDPAMLAPPPQPAGEGADPSAAEKRRPVVLPQVSSTDPSTWAGTSRNAPCPCGSGKKYKYCHGKAV